MPGRRRLAGGAGFEEPGAKDPKSERTAEEYGRPTPGEILRLPQKLIGVPLAQKAREALYLLGRLVSVLADKALVLLPQLLPGLLEGLRHAL